MNKSNIIYSNMALYHYPEIFMHIQYILIHIHHTFMYIQGYTQNLCMNPKLPCWPKSRINMIIED
jgi:hypothetical protein